MLEELGHRVLTVGDAASALEAIGKETFDLVVSDIIMLVVSDIIMPASMDGLAFARSAGGNRVCRCSWLPAIDTLPMRHRRTS